MQVTKVDVVPVARSKPRPTRPLQRVRPGTAPSTAQMKSSTSFPRLQTRVTPFTSRMCTWMNGGLRIWERADLLRKRRIRNGAFLCVGVYFLEVRPFREDILKMPGGEGGKAYQCPQRDDHSDSPPASKSFRQTHQHIQKTTSARRTCQAQDRKQTGRC